MPVSPLSCARQRLAARETPTRQVERVASRAGNLIFHANMDGLQVRT